MYSFAQLFIQYEFSCPRLTWNVFAKYNFKFSVYITSIPYVRIGRIFELKSAIAVSKGSSLMNFTSCIALVACVAFPVMCFVKHFEDGICSL